MGFLSRLAASFAASREAYSLRLADGSQPVPSPAWRQVAPFLDYTDTPALLAVNVAYLVVVAALTAVMRRRAAGFELRKAMIVRAAAPGAAPPRRRRGPQVGHSAAGAPQADSRRPARSPPPPPAQVYNAACVLLAGYVVVGIVRYKLAKPGTFACNGPDFSAAGRALSHASWVYYAQKFFEYGDTLFFVLRKSFRQLTFLHVYHHVSITLVTAAFLRYDVNGDNYLAALCNSIIHVRCAGRAGDAQSSPPSLPLALSPRPAFDPGPAAQVLMYGHYLCAAFGVDTWWKKQLTSLQARASRRLSLASAAAARL